MLTIKELESVIDKTEMKASALSLSLGRSEKFLYVILNQYRDRPVIGQRVSALLYSKYPKIVKEVVGVERAKTLKLIGAPKGKSLAGRKAGSKSYQNRKRHLVSTIKKQRPELFSKLNQGDFLFLAKSFN